MSDRLAGAAEEVGPSAALATPIRVLVIGHDTSMTGAQQSLHGLLGALNRDLVAPLVVLPGVGSASSDLSRLHVEWLVRGLTYWVRAGSGRRAAPLAKWPAVYRSVRERVWALARLIESRSIDLVYTNSVACVDGALAARRMGVPHVWHLREHLAGNRNISPMLPPCLMTRCIGVLSRKIVVNSKALAAHYSNAFTRSKIEVVHNGIDLQRFSPRADLRGSLRRDLGLEAEAILVGLVGSIAPTKGHLLLVEAAGLMRLTSGQRAHFVIIGDGHPAVVAQIRQRIDVLGLGEFFHFLGWRSDVAALMPDLDVLVTCSDQEAFGRTLVEAMACAVPVVATRSGGPEEIVSDAETGFLVRVNDAPALAAALHRLSADPQLRERMGQAARRDALARFDLQTYARRVQDIIIRVASAAREGAARRSSCG